MSRIAIARWILLLGLAFVFLWFGIDKFVHPSLWIGWMPDGMNGMMGMQNNSWMQLVAVTEIVIALTLIIPVRTLQQIASIAASLHLLAILTQVGWNEIAVRDIGLLFMSVAVWFLL